MNQILRKIIIPVVFTWLGFILGISFLEAPLKFQAPHITLELGLGIGRLVFGVLNKIEIMLSLIILIPSIYLFKQEKLASSFIYLIFMILLIQTTYLLPQLDIRAIDILDHKEVAPSNLHVFYVMFEGIKVILLVTSGILLLKNKDYEKGH